jgi:hypothetical protein
MSTARRCVRRGAKCAAIVATLNLSLAETFAACDLSPLTLNLPPSDVQFAGRTLRTETTVNLQFIPGPPGYIKVLRSSETFIPGMTEAIVAQLNAIDAELPKNECNQAGSLKSRSAQVTRPTFTISATVDGDLWVCSPVVKIPCPPKLELETPPRGLAASSYQIGEAEKANLLLADIFDDLKKVIPVPFPTPNNPLPIPTPTNPLPGVPIPMCDGPRVKTKLVGGRVTVTYVLSGQIRDDAATIHVSPPDVRSEANDQTKFLLGILSGPALSSFANGQLENQLKSIALDKARDVIPDKITLPDQPVEPIQWTTKEAFFDTKSHNGQLLPAFVVTQEYNTREIGACILRKEISTRQ